MKIKILPFFIALPLLLACNTSVPAKGYAKFKDDIKSKLPGNYVYKSCSYVYIKNVPSEPILNETCYYYSQYTRNGVGYYSYYIYEDATNRITYDMDKTQGAGYTYRLAANFIQQNPNFGSLGSL